MDNKNTLDKLDTLETLQMVATNEEILEEMEDLLDEFSSNEVYTRTTDCRENAIEWYNGQEIITVTLSQRRFINKIMNLAKEYPNEIKIDKINPDGTMLAHIPLSYLKIQKPRVMTEEEKEKARERLAKYRKTPKKDKQD